MNRKQIEKIIEELIKVYVDKMDWGLYASAHKVKKDIEEFEKRLEDGDYFS